MKFESCVFNIPLPTELRFFDKQKSFHYHAKEHFTKYPFHRLIDQVKPILVHSLCQQMPNPPVSLLQEFYDMVFPILERGVSFAVNTPVYIRYNNALVILNEGRVYRESGFYFLAKEGFHIGAHTGAVRTAFFTLCTPGWSDWSRFRDAWIQLHRRLVVDKGYSDSKYGKRYDFGTADVFFYSASNWLPDDLDYNAAPPADLLEEVRRNLQGSGT
jgi:hypothetical protein